ncbi:DUF4166 domain-containing protein [Niallia sp. Man26]|uniref:DUF4166 domain-containing protein n=1 Tax=Niallia sp. Man26 TaxID=2912824 RepID=UPI001EDB615C|nr:DUF4166 domain-containing protein [Niallia sp. Man26]UPO90716.1 DUF4166 domain-containing protein [Niallia sp. Man26]
MIYKEILGEEFNRLHPKLQERYSISLQHPFHGRGTMLSIISGKSWLKSFLKLAVRWKFLFPEEGSNIPFTIRNTAKQLPNGEQEIYWERTFYFQHVTRQFNAFMTIDAKRRIVKDYLGEPNLFYSDLKFIVTQEGSLQIQSGAQRLLLGKWEIPIPKLFEGKVTVMEGYDDINDVYTIQVRIHNPIIGRLMAYEGGFTSEQL